VTHRGPFQAPTFSVIICDSLRRDPSPRGQHHPAAPKRTVWGHSHWGVFPDPPIPKCSGEGKSGKLLSLPLIPRKAFSPGKETVACAEPQREPSPDIWLGKKVTKGDSLALLQPGEAANPGSSQTHAGGRAAQDPPQLSREAHRAPRRTWGYTGLRGSCRQRPRS